MQERIVIGTRATPLALAQSELVAVRLRRLGLEVVLAPTVTTGDRSLGGNLALARGMFTGELEAALLAGTIDLAVHSLKDLPLAAPGEAVGGGLGAGRARALGTASSSGPTAIVVAVLPRSVPEDVLVTTERTLLACTAPPAHRPLSELSRERPVAVAAASAFAVLAEGASLGTSSPRRQSAALALRPDLVCCAVRGSVERRVERLSDGAVDALLLAEAGLLRLLDAGHAPAAWQHLVAVRLEVDSWPTAPGQGALAVQVASASRWARHEAILALDDPPTRREVELERRVLERLGGGCLLPLGATVRAGTLFVALAEEGWRERACRGATPRVVSSSWRLAPAAELAAEPATEEVVAPSDAELDRWIEELREEERHTAAQIPDAVPGTEAVPSLFVVDLAELAGSEGRTGAGEAIDLVVTSNRAATERTTVALARAARPPRRVASVEVLEAKRLEVEWPNLLELGGSLGTSGRRSRSWVLVSSPTAAEILVARSALEPEWLRLPWCALGPGTARTLLALGVPPNLVARSRNALELAAFAIAHLPSQAPLLIPQSRRAGADLVARLRAAGRLAVAWDAYTVEPRRGVRWPHPLAPEHVLFTSPSAVEAWETNALPWPERSAWAMGARTAASLATRYGGRVLVAEEPSAVGIAALWEQDRS